MNNAFLSGFNREKQDDDDEASKGGNSGVSSAFQAGFQRGQQRRKAGKATSTLKKAQSPSGLAPTLDAVSAMIPQFKHGGPVKRTGVALVHRGEYVIPAKRSRRKTSRKRTIRR